MNICNPFGTPITQGMNPFETWQKLWLQGMQSVAPQQHTQPQLPAPMDMFGQFQAMQNLWLQGFGMPQQQAQAPLQAPLLAPKVTVTTIELGDMRHYMEMAFNMMQAFAPFVQSRLANQWSRK